MPASPFDLNLTTDILHYRWYKIPAAPAGHPVHEAIRKNRETRVQDAIVDAAMTLALGALAIADCENGRWPPAPALQETPSCLSRA